MACPCFYPVERAVHGGAAHAGRPVPPLGDIWSGKCCLTPQDELQPDRTTSEQLCNFGYAAHKCPRFPAASPDAVRFSIANDQNGLIGIQWVMEKDHLPFENGRLEYSRDQAAFVAPLSDTRLARQAEVYVRGYIRRTGDAS